MTVVKLRDAVDKVLERPVIPAKREGRSARRAVLAIMVFFEDAAWEAARTSKNGLVAVVRLAT